MDAKERAITACLHTLIKERRFSERDALAFLILLRQHAPAGSVVRELADFVAHRERDRGLMNRMLTQLDAFIRGKGERTLRVEPVVTASALLSCLNDIFARDSLGPFALSDAEDLLIAAMVLLQDVQLVANNAPLGHLVLAQSHAEVLLLGLVKIADGAIRPVEAAVPLVSVPRPAQGLPSDGTPALFPPIVEARCVDGALALFVGHARLG